MECWRWFTVWVLFATTVTAADKSKTVPKQVATVYTFVKAILADDIESFKNANSRVALKAYQQTGGLNKQFNQMKSLFLKKFSEDAELADFSFTAEKRAPGGGVELDGDYYMVMINVENVGGLGILVEQEDGEWKVTIPRIKNIEEILKAKAAHDAKSQKSDAVK